MACMSEEGFTLIELVLVVLILGVLLAISIPVLLSLTSTARSTGAESNVTSAAQDETNYVGLYGGYGTISSSPAISQLDGGLNWVVCAAGAPSCITDTGSTKTVYVVVAADGGNPAVEIGAAGTDQRSYWELESQNPSTQVPSYVVATSPAVPTIGAFERSPVSRSWKQAGG
jgi:type IV pilus assembly protein PilA